MEPEMGGLPVNQSSLSGRSGRTISVPCPCGPDVGHSLDCHFRQLIQVANVIVVENVGGGRKHLQDPDRLPLIEQRHRDDGSRAQPQAGRMINSWVRLRVGAE
jgi:hypothetical protein